MAKKTKSLAVVDTRGGSLSYNRLDFQVSQVFLFAIELYDTQDYLMILDHYDDISVFEDQAPYNIASHYQVKTKDDSISLSFALSEGWIEKLYSHMENPEWLVRELGLITNCPFKLEGKLLSQDKTPFIRFDQDYILKIKQDIAQKRSIPIADVDLSKMVHVRTTLSLDSHRNLVEGSALNFLVNRFPQIKAQVVKTIVAAVFDVLSRMQSYERLPSDAPFEKVASRKGFSKGSLTRIIKEAMKVNIPEFDTLVQECEIPKDLHGKAALAYTKVMADSHENTYSFVETFNALEQVVVSSLLSEDETLWEYSLRCKEAFCKKRKRLPVIYKDSYYIEILSACIYLGQEGAQDD